MSNVAPKKREELLKKCICCKSFARTVSCLRTVLRLAWRGKQPHEDLETSIRTQIADTSKADDQN